MMKSMTATTRLPSRRALFCAAACLHLSHFVAPVHGSFAAAAFRPHRAWATTTTSSTMRWMSSSSSSSSSSSQSTTTTTTHNDDILTMRVAEIRAELKERKVDYSDCFDKESLVARLKDARAGKAKGPSVSTTTTAGESTKPSSETTRATSSAGTATEKINDDQVLSELRAMTAKQLREELASRRLRWAGLLEKEDLVRAVLKARKEAGSFSATGLIRPGEVADLSGDQLQLEVESTAVKTPLLLDVYATWCGPCQMMAPQIKAAAEDWGDKVRVAKMDSDKNDEMSAKLRVRGLPSLILFVDGKEVDRIEGALMKEQLMQWVGSKL